MQHNFIIIHSSIFAHKLLCCKCPDNALWHSIISCVEGVMRVHYIRLNGCLKYLMIVFSSLSLSSCFYLAFAAKVLTSIMPWLTHHVVVGGVTMTNGCRTSEREWKTLSQVFFFNYQFFFSLALCVCCCCYYCCCSYVRHFMMLKWEWKLK